MKATASPQSRGSNPLAGLAAFRAFTATIGERCDEAPVASEVSVLGAYRFLEG